MPIISFFGSGGGGGGGGLVLTAVTNIQTLAAAGKVYVKWEDPDDLVVAGSTLAAWGGTLLVRKAGSAPVSRRDGTVVLDSKTRNAYQNSYFCDSGLTDGVTYYYKFFPYTTSNAYTDSTDDEFNKTPNPVPMGNISSASAVAAGNGKLDVKWTDPAATVVSDGVTLATWQKTVVVAKVGSAPTGPDDPNAAKSQVVTTRNAHATTPLTLTGLTNGTTYYIGIFPVSTDGAANTATANVITGVPNRKKITVAPAQSGTLTFQPGTAQSPQWDANYVTSKMTLSVTPQTNAGTWPAYFTPTDDWCWDDSLVVSGMANNLAAKPVNWKINQATGTLTLTPTSLTLNKDALSADFTIGGNFDGSYSVVSQDTSVATVALKSGKTYTVSSVNNTTGSTTIKITCSGGSNYTNPAEKSVTVTTRFLPPVGTALNACSWDDIKQISDAGQGANYWKVGDTKTIQINGKVGSYTFSNVSVDAYILGFNHNSAKEGTNRIHFQLGKIGGKEVALCDSNYGDYKTDSTKMFNFNHWGNYNYGGWAGSDLRYDILGSTNKAPSGYGSAKTTSTVGYDAPNTTPTNPVANTLMAALPSDLRAVMKPVTKYTDNTAGGADTASYVTATADYLFLLAEFEVFGSRSYANSAEKNYQLQYDYFKNGNSKVAYNHSANSTAVWWWLRSPYYDSNNYFCRVLINGTISYFPASWSAGVRPGFSV